MNYLFYFSANYEICYFADGSSPYSNCMNLDNIFTNLIRDIQKGIWMVYIQFSQSKSL